MTRPLPPPVLDWHRSESGRGVDGRFPLGVFMVRNRLGKWHIEFMPRERFASIIETPKDTKDRSEILKRQYDQERQAVYVAEGMAIAMMERIPAQKVTDTGDNIIDSIEQLLKEHGGKLTKAQILARLHFTDSQWTLFLERRPPTIQLESHGRGARYFYKAPAQAPRNQSRPSSSAESFDSYIGQASVISRMRQYVESAKRRKAPLDHVLLAGPPGVGKTTLARVIARELGRPLHVHWGPTLDVERDLSSTKPQEIIFIDEIHALAPVAQEQLFQVMTTGVTVVGATNYPGRLTPALRDRFSIRETLEMYSPAELITILSNVAAREALKMDPAVAAAIAQRSRGSAREAIALLHRVRDLDGLRPESVAAAFRSLEIDDLGLNKQDRRYLSILEESEEPIGLDALASKLGESADNVETSIEPFLLQSDLIERTPRGRKIADKGIAHLQAMKKKERRPPRRPERVDDEPPTSGQREAEPASNDRPVEQEPRQQGRGKKSADSQQPLEFGP